MRDASPAGLDPEPLDPDTLLALHGAICKSHLLPSGLRDEGRAFENFRRQMPPVWAADGTLREGIDLYAARLLDAFLTERPFNAGNLAMGALFLELLLQWNGYALLAEEKQFAFWLLGCRERRYAVADMARWIGANRSSEAEALQDL